MLWIGVPWQLADVTCFFVSLLFMTTNRPATHKPRGVCRYYNVPRGCFAGDKCKFLHGEPPVDPKPEEPPLLTPYDKAKRCRYYAQGRLVALIALWGGADGGL